MKENNIKAHYTKPYIKTTKDCDFSNRLHNILKRDLWNECGDKHKIKMINKQKNGTII